MDSQKQKRGLKGFIAFLILLLTATYFSAKIYSEYGSWQTGLFLFLELQLFALTLVAGGLAEKLEGLGKIFSESLSLFNTVLANVSRK